MVTTALGPLDDLHCTLRPWWRISSSQWRT